MDWLLGVLLVAWVALLIAWAVVFVWWVVTLCGRRDPAKPFEEATDEWGRRVFWIPAAEADSPECAVNHWFVPPFGEPVGANWWKVTATYGAGDD